MSYKRHDDHITLELTADEFAGLLLALGYAAGAAHGRGEVKMFYGWLRLVNAINDGNPDFTPYAIPDSVSDDPLNQSTSREECVPKRPIGGRFRGRAGARTASRVRCFSA
jgi:hypothetical protein